MSCDLIQLATPGVAGLNPYQPGKPVSELERELGITDIIKLASNENPLGAGEKVRSVLKDLPDISRYPDGNGHSLKIKLAQKHSVDPARIILGNGSNDVLELIARAIVSHHHEVIYSAHAFAIYPLIVQAIGAHAVEIPARDWGSDLEAMHAAITARTRLIFIANPNNPTGTWSNNNDLYSLLKQVPEQVVVVVDEAYFEYVQESDYPDATKWLEEFSNLVVTRTFSKAHGLAGLRIGYALSHPDLVDLMNRVRQPFNVNTVAMIAAEIALDDCEHIKNSIELNNSGYQQLIMAFDSMGLHYIPSVANFVCIDIQQSCTKIYQQLLKKGVIVRSVENYGMPGHLRVTIGHEYENDKFLMALADVLSE